MAARFEDDSFSVGRMRVGKREVISVLNWKDTPQNISIQLRRRCRITDFWTAATLGSHAGVFEIKDMPGRSGRLLICAADKRG